MSRIALPADEGLSIVKINAFISEEKWKRQIKAHDVCFSLLLNYNNIENTISNKQDKLGSLESTIENRISQKTYYSSHSLCYSVNLSFKTLQMI